MQELLSPILNLPPLVFHGIIALVSLIVLAKSADMLVYSISNYARKLGVSDYLIGFLVVSIGTTLPEMIAAINGALFDKGPIVFGTIFGSNLFKIPLLGIVILIVKKIKITKNAIGTAPLITFAIAILPIALIFDGTLSRIDGIILLAAFILYIAKLWNSEGKLGKMKKNVKLKNIYRDGIIFGLSLAAMLLSGRWLVSSSLRISEIMNIPIYFVGLVIIGIGASAPELMVQVRSVLNHHEDLAFGNVFGSIVANCTLALGITALIKPISMQFAPLMITAISLIIGILAILFLLGRKEVSWKHGIVLVMIYITFLISEWLV